MHSLRHGPLHFSRDPTSRFTDPLGECGVLYAAEDTHGAFIETFGRQLDVRIITSSTLMTKGLTRVDASRPLRLVDLASSGGLARLGADGRLTSGPFDVAQTWSRALWEHPADADGIYYRLRHDPARCGCAIYDRARDVLTATSAGTLWDPPRRAELGDVLDACGFALIVE